VGEGDQVRTYTLLRVRDTGEETLGWLLQRERIVAHTLELPWKDNQRVISCIPIGEYKCTWHQSPRFGWTYLVNGVPDRSAILFHAGNTVGDTDGCILLGDRPGKMGDMPAVLGSRGAVASFFTETATETFWLKVRRLDTGATDGVSST
jgi:hypothetical protein